MKKTLIALALIAALGACGHREEIPVFDPSSESDQPVVSAPAQSAQQQQAPVASQDGFDTGDALLGGAIGYMLGSAAGSRHETVIEKHYQTPPPKPVYRPAPSSKPRFSFKPKRRSFSFRRR